MARLERLKELEQFEIEQKLAQYEQEKRSLLKLQWLKKVELKQMKAENTLKKFIIEPS